MKKILALTLAFVMLFVLCSCRDKNEEEQKLDVNLTINEGKSLNGRLCIETNLPALTKLDVDIFQGDKYHSTETVEVKTDVETNYFVTETKYDLDGEIIKDGTYIVSINLVNPASQPASVQEVIGKNGEKLTGLYSYDTNNGKTIKLQRPLVKENDNFSMPIE